MHRMNKMPNGLGRLPQEPADRFTKPFKRFLSIESMAGAALRLPSRVKGRRASQVLVRRSGVAITSARPGWEHEVFIGVVPGFLRG
ncbi:hypothetical protein V5F29_12095 [Xanthobacter aminoxidans]|uniref:hypothetical protein n=1 Tax=Xanthobacter aminoxidans TaxID=186280 RepID=UPI00372C6A60